MSQLNVPGSNSTHRPVTLKGDFSKKLVTNTFFNLLGRFWSFLVALLLTPYILAHLDVREFGTWVALSIFISSFGLLDLGLGSAFVKHIAEYYAHQDFGRINRVLSSGLLFYSAIGLFQVSIGLVLEGPLFSVFHVPKSSEAYLLVLLSCALTNVSVMFLSVFKGIQRMDKSSSLEIKMSIVNVAGTILFSEGRLGHARTC